MSNPDAYIMLISSLPHLKPLYHTRQPPLSRLRLNRRLRDLSTEDAEILQLVEDALSWRELPMTLSDQQVIERGRKALHKLRSQSLQRIVRHRLELRTCVAALRRRTRGEEPPVGASWGFGRWVGHMERNWTHPGFRLEGVFPWLREADRLIRGEDVAALERLLLRQAYKGLQRARGLHTFDFEAVVIYVLKWNILDRIARYNGEAAVRRFEDLTQIGLGKFAAMSEISQGVYQ